MERYDDELGGISKKDERLLCDVHIKENSNITMPLSFKKDESSHLNNQKLAVLDWDDQIPPGHTQNKESYASTQHLFQS